MNDPSSPLVMHVVIGTYRNLTWIARLCISFTDALETVQTLTDQFIHHADRTESTRTHDETKHLLSDPSARKFYPPYNFRMNGSTGGRNIPIRYYSMPISDDFSHETYFFSDRY